MVLGNCTLCKTEIEKRTGDKRFKFKPKDPLLDAITYDIPFYCTQCGAIKFPLKAIHDFVFIYPLYKDSTLGSGILSRPPTYVPDLSDYGIVLSYGKGHYNKKGRFMPVTNLQVGMKVIYDKQVPWEMEWDGTDNRPHLIKYMAFPDIKLVPDLKGAGDGM